ncbi:hypothetical protein BASA61_001272 [Batrachochytrium salamandrivorans]|nr:hypothetical protein BASA61_001272 [Batrachochytrium salamandrivorans]
MADELEWESMIMEAGDASIDDQIKGKDEVSFSSRIYKSDEEVERFMVDESLTKSDRTLFILRNGSPLQKLSIANSLNHNSINYGEEFCTSVLPLILEMIVSESVAFQRTIGRFLSEFLSKSILPPKTVQSVLSLSKKFLENKDEDTAAAWADVYISCIKHLSIDAIVQQILPDALADGGLAQPASYRIWCCRILGAIATRLDGKRIEDLFLFKALSLCQDTDYDVRKSMCYQLNSIAKGVGPKITKTVLLPEYLELVMDEEFVVREAAIDNLICLLEFLDSETRSSTIIPLWRRLCDERPHGIVNLIAKQLGAFLWQMKGDMADTDKKYFLAFYHSLVAPKISDETLRGMCAYNFPGMVMLYKPANFDVLKFDKILDMMVSDTSLNVRNIVAQGFHELGVNAFKKTKEHLIKLATTENIQILQTVLTHIETILKVYASDETSKGTIQLDGLLVAIVNHERIHASTHILKWRVHYDILLSYKLFPDYFDSDLIFEQCVPSLFKILSTNTVMPIKSLVIETLVCFLRKIKRLEHRETILRQLIELKESRSCHQRILFLTLCETILNVFSRKFFRDHIFYHYLGLSRDSVANIRLRFCSLVPLVRCTLRTPLDMPILQKLIDATDSLATRDTDKDVMVAMKHILIQFGPLDGKEFNGKLTSAASTSQDVDINQGQLSSSNPLMRVATTQPSSSLGGGSLNQMDTTVPHSQRDCRSMSASSLTDNYLVGSASEQCLLFESDDKIKEEEEVKLLFEQMCTEWIGKRRDPHELRQEIHRRFGDREPAKKTAATVYNGRSRGSGDTAGGSGTMSGLSGFSGSAGSAGSAGSVPGSSGSGGNSVNSSKSGSSTSRRRAPASFSQTSLRTPSTCTNGIITAVAGNNYSSSTASGSDSQAQSTVLGSTTAVAIAATATAASPTSSKTSLAAVQQSQMPASFITSQAHTRGQQASNEGSSSKRSTHSSKSVGRSSWQGGAGSLDHTDDTPSPKGGPLLNTLATGKSYLDDFRSLDHELAATTTTTTTSPVNLSKAGVTSYLSVSLPKVQARPSPHVRPFSRQIPTERVPELPAASTLKKSYRG